MAGVSLFWNLPLTPSLTLFTITLLYAFVIVPKLCLSLKTLVFSEPLMSVGSYHISPQPLFCWAEQTSLHQSFPPKQIPAVTSCACCGWSQPFLQGGRPQGRQRHQHCPISADAALSDAWQNHKGFFVMVSYWQLTALRHSTRLSNSQQMDALLIAKILVIHP